jgi:CRP-like cAMP-binding protein
MAEEYENLARRAEARAADRLAQYDPQKQTVPGRPKTERVKRMARIPDVEEFRSRLAGLPVLTFRAGEIVLAAGSTTGQLLVLRQGAVEILRDGIQLARVSEQGAVFGELAALLNKPHTADVRALEDSVFSVADAPMLFGETPSPLLYVAALLARRLDRANTALLDVKHQLRASKSHSEIASSVANLEQLLNGGTGYSGYPFGPFSASPHH